MRIIFIKDHIIDDELGIMVMAGRKGLLMDDTVGRIELDVILELEKAMTKSEPGFGVEQEDDEQPAEEEFSYGTVVYGIIEGVQPSKYISLRKDS